MGRRSKQMLGTAALGLLLAVLVGCPEDPARIERSPNGKFMVKAGRGKTRVLTTNDPPKELWTIDGVTLEKCIVADDGETVAVLRRSHGEPPSGDHIALRLVHRERGEIKAYKLKELCDDFDTVGDMRLGRLIDLVQWYRSDAMRGDKLVVTTVDHFELQISLKTGAIVSKEKVMSFGEKCLIVLGGCVVVVLIGTGTLVFIAVAVFKRSGRTAEPPMQ
ncbi:MAG: hypothetical protein HY289_05800 [Planctomycetes bacterium]|nr:hypothetical protein [Planctomycetota bacterium]